MKEKKIIGIYKITHKTGYFYIGCSLNIIKRWDSHLKMLEKNKHHCKDFQKIYNDSEINDFTFEILETINKKTTPTLTKL
jgi:predicted GIY-YIG superfamily endonuclease